MMRKHMNNQGGWDHVVNLKRSGPNVPDIEDCVTYRYGETDSHGKYQGQPLRVPKKKREDLHRISKYIPEEFRYLYPQPDPNEPDSDEDSEDPEREYILSEFEQSIHLYM